MFTVTDLCVTLLPILLPLKTPRNWTQNTEDGRQGEWDRKQIDTIVLVKFQFLNGLVGCLSCIYYAAGFKCILSTFIKHLVCKNFLKFQNLAMKIGFKPLCLNKDDL